MNVRYEELLPRQVVERRRACPVAFLPIGGVEWHGRHLCLGNDAVKAHALCCRIAEARGGLVFPALFWGENRERSLMEFNADARAPVAAEMDLPVDNFAPGYMHENPDDRDYRYVRLLVHCLHEIASLGFEVIVISAGHYPLIRHARAAVEMCVAGRRYDRPVRAWVFTGYELVRDLFPEAGDHAAHWETSLLMALRPELVDMGELPEDPDVPLVGVSGIDPRTHASADLGERAVAAIVERVGDKVRKLLLGEHENA